MRKLPWRRWGIPTFQGRASQRRRRVHQPELLEARQLLASDLLITEFLAGNSRNITDEDGEFSDWIEIQNRSAAAVSLAGYSLTDSLSEPGKWHFPDLDLGAGEYLVVFASGKDRASDLAHLHTNFKLSEEGEYLALVAPDGATVIQQFDPFPRQRTGVSYGLPQTAAVDTLVDAGSAAQVIAPLNGRLASTWTQPAFQPTGWTAGVAAVGYDQATNYDAYIGTDLAGAMSRKNASAYLRVPFQVNDPAAYDFLNLAMRYDDGFVAYLNGAEVARRNAPSTPQWNSTASGPHSGMFDSVNFPNFSTPGMTLRGSSQVSNGRLQLTNAFTDQRGAAWTTEPIEFGGSYSFSTQFSFELSQPGGPSDNQDGVGGEGFAFTIQSTGANVLGSDSTSYGLLGGNAAVQKFISVEFDTRPGGAWDTARASGSHIAVNTHLSSISASAPVRVPRFNDGGVYQAWVDYDGASRQLKVYFSQSEQKPLEPTVATVIDFQELFGGERALTVGFSAGTTSATNRQEIVNWTFASGESELGLTPETINLSQYLDLLVPGTNVLAIQGLNVTADDVDFFLAPQLTATDLDAPITQFKYFGSPSPGASNGDGFDGLALEPVFSLPAGVYDTQVSVTLSSPTPGAVIYYTLNNTTPTTSSTPYLGPITTDASTIVRAISVKDGYMASETAVARYTVLAADVQDFSSNLPLVVLDTYGRNPSESALTEVAATFVDTGASGRATLDGAAEYHGRGAFKLRGSSSIGFPKQQFAFEVWDEAGEDRSVSLLGMPEESDWIIYAPYSEKSLMQNALAYDWSRKMGQYAPRVRFIELYINSSGGVSAADYRGVYILLEKIKRDPARVDIAELTPQDNAEPEITGGYILKKDRLDPGDAGFTTSRGQTLGFVEPKEDEVTPTQRAYITGYLNAFENALYGADFANPVEGYAKYIDIDSFIDSHIMVELAKNIDGYRLSTYMYKDRNGKLVMGPAWDYNLSMGNANYLQGDVPQGWYYTQLGGTDYPWYGRLFQDPAFQQRYIDRWTELRRGVLSTESMMADVDAYASLLDEAQVRNFQRWPILGVYVWPNPNGYQERNTYQKEVDFLKNFLRQRAAWMDSSWPYAPVFSRPGGDVPQDFPLDLFSAGQAIYYTTDGTDPRLANGSVNPSAIYVEPNSGTPVLPLGSPAKYLVPRSNSLGTSWLAPEFDDSAWQDAVTGIGFDADGSLAPYIATDISAEMSGVNASVYVRQEFQLTNPADYKALRLRIQYDDGFVAYLNGVEIYFRNVTPRGRAYNGSASADRSDAQATQAEVFDLSAFVDLLRPGRNVLAFQALNNGAAQADFLFAPEIVDITGKAATIILDRSVTIQARAMNRNVWSGITQATYVVGDGAPLRVTELMYAPTGQPGVDAGDFEYIELQNTGSAPLTLDGIRFTAGVTATLANGVLQAGERGVVVANQAAFTTRYGNTARILGEFTGRLSNNGETVTLTGPLGETIQSFTYDDLWYPATDGGGYSLVMRNPHGAKGTWNDKSAWRASFAVGGTPGADERLPGDANQDGVVNLDDLNAVRNAFGTSAAGDANGDGRTDLDDLNEVRNALGLSAAPIQSSPTQRRRIALPLSEPASNARPFARQHSKAKQAWDAALLELLESSSQQASAAPYGAVR